MDKINNRLKHINNIKRKNVSPTHAGRVVATLNREQIDFIDMIAKDALYSTGHKLTRSEIVEVMVRVARSLITSNTTINTADELEKRILMVAKDQLHKLAEKLAAEERRDE